MDGDIDTLTIVSDAYRDCAGSISIIIADAEYVQSARHEGMLQI